MQHMNAPKGKAARPVVTLRPMFPESSEFGPTNASWNYLFCPVSVSGDADAMGDEARKFSQDLLEDAKVWGDRSEFARQWQDIEQQIAKTGRRDLGVLVKAGIGRKTLLCLLSLAALSGEKEWRAVARRKIAALRSLGGQLDTVARHAERMALDSLCYAKTWGDLISASLEFDPFFAIYQPIPVGLFRSIREHANGVRAQAHDLGRSLRRAGVKERRRVVLLLLYRIARSTRRDCDPELARLLTDAFEAAGRPKHFSADRLRKYRDRYVLPLLASRRLDKPAP